MKRPLLALSALLFIGINLSGCSRDVPSSRGEDPNQAALERLELRVNQLERKLSTTTPTPPGTGANVPAGPLRSLTVRLGTNDDRLRLYWADGQTSDLMCSQEGKGIWACG